MNTPPAPPVWAETLLRLVIDRTNAEAVSGDLLEEYRESVRPVRGAVAADLWYVGEVMGFVIRGVRVWGTLFGAAVLIRTALDWFAPTADFATRSAVSTYSSAGILFVAGFWASRRSGSVLSGAVAGTAAAVIAAAIAMAGAAGLFALRHDAGTLAAIQGSGGLGEVFTLPLLLVLPGAGVGLIGGLAGAVGARLRSA